MFAVIHKKLRQSDILYEKQPNFTTVKTKKDDYGCKTWSFFHEGCHRIHVKAFSEQLQTIAKLQIMFYDLKK